MDFVKNHDRLTGIIMLVIGIILLVWPGSTLMAFCRLMGWCLLLGGALEIIAGIAGSKVFANAAGGAVAAVVGVIFIARPNFIIGFLPFAVGLITALGGVAFLVRALVQHYQGPTAVLNIAGSVVAIIVGVILMVNAYTAVKLLMIVLGVFLVYFGIIRIGNS